MLSTSKSLHGESPDWSQEISEDLFVSRFKDIYVKDKVAVKQRVSEALNNLLLAADLNKDGVFTFEKFFKFHEAFNLGHDIVVRTTFDLVGPSAEDTCTFGIVHDYKQLHYV